MTVFHEIVYIYAFPSDREIPPSVEEMAEKFPLGPAQAIICAHKEPIDQSTSSRLSVAEMLALTREPISYSRLLKENGEGLPASTIFPDDHHRTVVYVDGVLRGTVRIQSMVRVTFMNSETIGQLVVEADGEMILVEPGWNGLVAKEVGTIIDGFFRRQVLHETPGIYFVY